MTQLQGCLFPKEQWNGQDRSVAAQVGNMVRTRSVSVSMEGLIAACAASAMLEPPGEVCKTVWRRAPVMFIEERNEWTAREKQLR